ncbi:dihydrofolate reductase family protein [Nocardia sp. NPDC046763]|uniref:dihydrofolate reductase family protein n=1 Tax=Nocardia sp. NPDC046763 TaxID=3155256 RepID=UPI0033F73AA4
MSIEHRVGRGRFRTRRLDRAPYGDEASVHRSGALVRSLLAADLVDTLNIYTFPVILGAGKRLFPENARPTAFTLTESRVTSKGVILATYRETGAPAHGTVGVD